MESKTLDARFKQVVREGLGCSPFEAEAVLDVVREVYGPYFSESPSPPLPGCISLVAVDAEEPAGKPVEECEKRVVCLTLHRGVEDVHLMQEQGLSAYRHKKIPEICQEAMSQGALLTREDLAYHVFMVSLSTISRHLRELRRDAAFPLPLRSTRHDIGPLLTHRVQIVRLALEGKTTTQICTIMHHSPQAVSNYVSTFTRVAQLAERGMQAGQIAFLLRRGKGLVASYLELLEECRKDANYAYHLKELLDIAQQGGGKNQGAAHHEN
jgi:DNA-binding NarL/FixJ family response regulator